LPDGATQPTLFDGETDTSDSMLKQPNESHDESELSSASDLDDLSDIQRSILAEIGTEHVGVDLIIERTALQAQIVLQALTFLTLKGRVKRIDGQTFARTKDPNGSRQ
jgi:predicted Rossmann fold nucleotide-binding protein DprA/Smf involved in DNA uptake